MIIEKFQEKVEALPAKTAIKAGNRTISYRELSNYAARVANAFPAGDGMREGTVDDRYRRVSLLFEHGADMIIAVLGVLKAGRTYVPLDITYPMNRLSYMLENSDSGILLTNEDNIQIAAELAARSSNKIDILNIDAIIREDTEATLETPLDVTGDSFAYILYTSGSTGRPKGVAQTHRNVLYYTRNWIQRFSITESDRMTLFSAFSHDGSVQDMFAALLAGATLYPYYIKTANTTNALYALLMKEKITIWHSVPSLYRFFANTLTEKNCFYDIRWVLLGGEPLRPDDLVLFKNHFPKAHLANVYGQTESSVCSICSLSQNDIFDAMCLGEPLDETKILLMGKDGDIVQTMGAGEIIAACDYIAPGYWRDEENSKAVFTQNDKLGRLYWTGDQGRLTADGLIKVMGRKDFQTKIRGFRVETGEIESLVLRHAAVKEAVILVKKDENNENYLCAYIVSDNTIPSQELKEYLSRELPDYMIPRYFISLEKMPVTPSGKINRRRLPEPTEMIASESEYVAPTNEVEKKLVAIWQDVLAVEKIGINDNFIELGGHSLLVISILSKIHREFNVELQLGDVFNNPTIKEMAELVAVTEEKVFSSIDPIEKKEYYLATSDQKRMFILNRFEKESTAYNLPGSWKVEGKLDWRHFEKTFQKLVDRHDAFRTSFKLLDDELIQVVHNDVDFRIQYTEIENGGPNSESTVKDIAENFSRPFDLGVAPLIRVGLVKLSTEKYLLLLDSHHIITDGVSEHVYMQEFSRLFTGEELPGLKLRYRDYSEWQNSFEGSGQFKKQEEYWLDVFNGEIPVLDLPNDYPRPDIQCFDGDIVGFVLNKAICEQINRLTKETGTTLFIVLLAMFNVLLHKYTGREDIIIGSIIAGRNHVDLENIVGFFVKTLALRNYPTPNKSFNFFLEELKSNTLNAYENQMYPFSRLINKLKLGEDRSRNPLFDAALVLQNTNLSLSEKPGSDVGLTLSRQSYEIGTSLFDLNFQALEAKDGIFCGFQYNTALFKRETIELMRERFLVLVESILNNRDSEIRFLDWRLQIEKEIDDVRETEFDF